MPHVLCEARLNKPCLSRSPGDDSVKVDLVENKEAEEDQSDPQQQG
jgi:hypothetical protein